MFTRSRRLCLGAKAGGAQRREILAHPRPHPLCARRHPGRGRWQSGGEWRACHWPAHLSPRAYNLDDFHLITSSEIHRALAYLLEEVLHQQPETTQEFLLKTSILKRFSAALCNVVTGRTG
jgi:hypothetical protein